MKVRDKVSFFIDTELYNGRVHRIDSDTADVLTFMGLVCNVPVVELNTT